MAFSTLYNAICRGKWFISFREVDANLLLVDRLLSHDAPLAMGGKLSDDEPIPVMLEQEGRLMKRGNTFSDAPQGSTAIIPLHGTMLKYGTMCAYGTTEIADLIREAAEAKNISSIVIDIDSGGGSVDAIAPLVDAIHTAQQKHKAVVASCSMSASAAYYVATYCNEIVADNSIDAEFGSIGVMMRFMDYAKYYEKEGIKVHTIYSNLSDYKNKPFEEAKKENYAAIRDEELDPLARDFQENVKRNRGARLLLDTEGLLRGRMFYHREAVRVGLADAIGTLQYASNRSRELSAQMYIDDYIHSKS